MIKKILLSFIFCAANMVISKAQWAELGTGSSALNANDDIRVVAVDDSGNVYAAGEFFDSEGVCSKMEWR